MVSAYIVDCRAPWLPVKQVEGALRQCPKSRWLVMPDGKRYKVGATAYEYPCQAESSRFKRLTNMARYTHLFYPQRAAIWTAYKEHPLHPSNRRTT